MPDGTNIEAEVEAIPEEIVIKLKKAVTWAETTYSEIKLREPTVAQMIEWSKAAEREADAKAIAIVSGVPVEAVKQMMVSDFNKGLAYITRFL